MKKINVLILFIFLTIILYAQITYGPSGTPYLTGGSSGAILNGHPTIEGVTSTGATGTGNIVYATAPVVDLTNATNVPSPGPVERHTASNSASLDFTTAFTSTYDNYAIDITNLVSVTDTVTLGLLVSTDGGSTWQSSNYHYMYWVVTDAGATGANTSFTATSFQICDQISTTAGRGISAHLELFNPLSATNVKNGIMQTSWYSSDGHMRSQAGSFIWNATTAVNAIRFAMSSGNIASGTIRVYGITK